jgi:enoyl-CoA hydratase/carnithine racemase
MPGAASEEPMADEVLVGHGDRIAIIMISRPQARNAISANGKLEP